MRIICKLIGHKWARIPIPYGTITYSECLRCGEFGKVKKGEYDYSRTDYGDVEK